SNKYTIQTNQEIITGTLNILHYAARDKFKRIIMHLHHLQIDLMKHFLNRKICVEVQCLLMQSASILGNIIARFFTIYLALKRFRLDISMFLDHDKALILNTPRLYLHLLKLF